MNNAPSINSFPTKVLSQILFESSKDEESKKNIPHVCKLWNRIQSAETSITKLKELKNFNISNCAGYLKNEYIDILEKIHEQVFSLTSLKELKETNTELFHKYGFKLDDVATFKQFESQLQALSDYFIETLSMDKNEGGCWANLSPELMNQFFGPSFYNDPSLLQVCKSWYKFADTQSKNVWENLRDRESTPPYLKEMMISFESVNQNINKIYLMKAFLDNYVSYEIVFREISTSELQKNLIDFIKGPRVSFGFNAIWKILRKSVSTLPNLQSEKLSIWLNNKENLKELELINNLNLADQKLSRMPHEVLLLKNLESISIANHNFTHIPKYLLKLEKLKKINFENNKISTIPEWFFQCTQLKEINFIFNNLKEIPKGFGEFQQLEKLSLRSLEVKELTELFKLKNLKILDLTHNPIGKKLPEICQLENLIDLNLRSTKMKKIPKQLFQINKLEKLNLSENKIRKIPEKIYQLENLKQFNLSKNKITNIPQSIGRLENLEHFDISNNMITNIPEEICELKKLKKFNLETNKIIIFQDLINELIKNDHLVNLEYNPIMLISNKNLEECKKIDIIGRLSEEMENEQEFPLGNLCLEIMRNSEEILNQTYDTEAARTIFDQLDPEDKKRIDYLTWIAAGFDMNNFDQFWGELHRFDDMLSFTTALTHFVILENQFLFKILPDNEKIHRMIYKTKKEVSIRNIDHPVLRGAFQIGRLRSMLQSDLVVKQEGNLCTY